MDRQIKKSSQHLPAPQAKRQQDPFAELERFFDDPLVSRDECVDLIAWWGVSFRNVSWLVFIITDYSF
jgi:hypothetical protein